jgi:preprotein translocase subunit SecD
MRKRLTLSLIGIVVVAYGSLAATLLTDTRPALGLDLQGGISVTQRAKPGTEFSDESMDLAVEKLRERVDALGVAEPEILRQGDTIVVNLPGVKNQRQAEELVQITGQVYLRPVLGCQELADEPDATGSSTTGSSTTGSSTTVAGGPPRPASPDNSTTTTTSAATTTAATTTAATTTTTTTGVGSSTTTTTEQVPLDEHGLPIQQSDPTSNQFLPLLGDARIYCQVGPAQGTGEVFSDTAAARVLPTGWGVTVDLRDGSQGRDIWNSIAAQCFSRTESCPTGQLGIELDGTIQSAPSMNTSNFTTGVEISGDFNESDARNLARVLNSGALPVQLQLESVENVSPTLGKDSLRAAWISGLVGVGLVLVFMMLYYRLLGVIVAIGVTVSASLMWSTISILSKTQGLALSLSGIAGIIVSVGVTIDSYVVLFERLKDEVRSGKTLRNSAQRGFTGAWRTIVIADLVSLIGAFVLWYLTVGAVRGFAFFLGLSTLLDLFVAYFFTRPTVLLLARTKWMERRKVMGIEVSPAVAQ